MQLVEGTQALLALQQMPLSLEAPTAFKICLLGLQKRNCIHHRFSPLKQHLNSDGAIIWGGGPREFNQDVNNFYPFSQQWEK